ncbi:hypothetical protein TSTA_075080 [Talaromyces stipitatus ATCC 10500]|uniref:Ankyrin repeat-containing protein n=1 Tax=Talaromyces stipitatus (strain ATCC 10500 / CBS 375.48 / QM 6759 / NRRL 1006) TaxID=441959 RepID=B8LWA4_TALSN|nr:uncharacterized protein TSTA_075080 [Talaromyces stipitatus ATCC 10500]EED24132.1 hypothetical protein TSTA_075080 [Talaromyces stipitatus ATCC 10500]
MCPWWFPPGKGQEGWPPSAREIVPAFEEGVERIRRYVSAVILFRWIRIGRRNASISSAAPETVLNAPVMILAAFFCIASGLPTTFSRWLSSEFNGAYQIDAAYDICGRIHEAVAKLLIEKGADINISD